MHVSFIFNLYLIPVFDSLGYFYPDLACFLYLARAAAGFALGDRHCAFALTLRAGFINYKAALLKCHCPMAAANSALRQPGTRFRACPPARCAVFYPRNFQYGLASF